MWVRFGCQGFPLQSCVLGLVLVRVPLLLKSWLCSRNVMMVEDNVDSLFALQNSIITSSSNHMGTICGGSHIGD
jgi:hypothetical protein